MGTRPIASRLARYRLPVFAVLSWLGLFLHNVTDLPGHTLLSPESLIPLILISALVALCLTRFQTGAAWLLLAWGILNLAGAIGTVVPLAILPFDPEQSLEHYAFHLLYGLTQLPLIIAALVWLRRPRTGAGVG